MIRLQMNLSDKVAMNMLFFLYMEFDSLYYSAFPVIHVNL